MKRFNFLSIFIMAILLTMVQGYATAQLVKMGRFPSANIKLKAYAPATIYRPAGGGDERYEIEAEDAFTFEEAKPQFRKNLTWKKVDKMEIVKKDPPKLNAKALIKSQWDVDFGGVDPMLAVGHEYMVVCDGYSLGYYNKTGQNINKGTLATNVRQLFALFLDRNLADGSANPNHPNNWFPDILTDVPDACNISDPNGDPDDGIIQAAYDTRVLYEKTYKRFVILCAIRNHCWGCSGCNVAEKNICKNNSVRLFAWAVSVSQDPRDGFYVYMNGTNNVRDWPRVVVDQDYMVVAHDGKGRMGSPAITIYSWPDLVAGSGSPRKVKFLSDQISPRMYIPVHNRLPASNQLIFAHKFSDSHIGFYHIKKPGIRSDIFKSGAIVRPSPIGSISYSDKIFKGPLSGITYDNKGIHFATTGVEGGQTATAAPRYAARVWTVPVVSGSGGSLSFPPLLNEATGYVHCKIASSFSYEQPAIAVDILNNIFVGFVRSSVTADGRPPEIRYTIWKYGEQEPANSTLLRKSESQPTYRCVTCSTDIPDNLTNKDGDNHYIDYAWAVADPAETAVFWLAHTYFNSSGQRRMHVAKASLY